MIPPLPAWKTMHRVSRFASQWVMVFFCVFLFHLLALPVHPAPTGAAAGKVNTGGQPGTFSSSRISSFRIDTDPLAQWVVRNKAMPADANLESVAYGNGLFVAVGNPQVSSSCPIYTSPDGIVWTQQTLPAKTLETLERFFGVTYGNGLFVAVGASRTGADDLVLVPTIFTSPDGATWTQRTAPVEAGLLSRLYGVTHGNGTFVAVGHYFTDDTMATSSPVVLTSPDGVTWTRRTPPGGNRALAGAGYGNGTFVAVGYDRSIKLWEPDVPVLLTSPDGETWTQQTVPPQIGGVLNGLSSVTYGNGLFVAAGYNYDNVSGRTVPTIFTSPNGAAWTQRTLPTIQTGAVLRSVTYGNGVFAAVGGNDYYGGFVPIVLFSPNGATWTQVTMTDQRRPLSGITYGNDMFVAVGGVDAYDNPVPAVLTSPDGSAWTWRTSAAQNGTLLGITYGNDMFVAVGESDYGYAILASSDGITWTPGTQPYQHGYTNGLGSVTYGNGTFAAAGFNYHDTAQVYTPVAFSSSDGINWTQGTLPALVQTGALNGVTYGNGIFVAAGYSHTTTPHVYTPVALSSSDGINWTQATLPAQTGALYGVTYGNNMFAAVGDAVFTSPDGNTWTRRAGKTFYGVTYGNGMFVAAGANIFTSSDGIKWTQRTTSKSKQRLTSVTYGNGSFVAVGWDDYPYIPIVLFSSDGITWTRKTSPVAAGLLSGGLFCVTNGNGTFVAVGDEGVIIQSQSGGSEYTLFVARSGAGSGAVVSSPDGINCGSTCSAPFAKSSSATLTATAASGSTFKSWSGCTSSSGNICIVTMDQTKTVTATFIIANPMKLTVAKVKQNGGDGTVVSSPDGINCGSICSAPYAPGAQVTLTASADAGSVFTSWSGCASSSDTLCTVTMDKAKTVKAGFAGPQTLTVKNASVNKGSGTVMSDPAGINCASGSCKGTFAYNTEVTLTASADAGSVFTSWSGCASSSDTLCTVTMDKAKTVKAGFAGPQTLTVKNASVNKGSGTVMSDPGDINCTSGSTGICKASLPYNTGVTLTAVPDSGSSVASWSVPGCNGATCVVTMTKALSITVKFKK